MGFRQGQASGVVPPCPNPTRSERRQLWRGLPVSAAASGGALQQGPAAGLVLGTVSGKSEHRCVVGQPWLRTGYKTFLLAFTDQGAFGCWI